jgi:hypothetical protein
MRRGWSSTWRVQPLKVNADTELDPALRRKPGVAFDESVLHLDRTPHGVDHASELDERAVAGALHDTAVMGDGGVDQVAPRSPLSRDSAICALPSFGYESLDFDH